MQVTSGAEWTTSSATGNKQNYAVTVDDADLKAQGIVGVDSMPVVKKWRHLSYLADVLVVTHLQENNVISSEMAAARLAELKAKKDAAIK